MPRKKRVDSQAKETGSLARVPAENVFRCYDGKVFADLKELAGGLAAMSDDTFRYHANERNNDFANWTRSSVKDEKLADDLLEAQTREAAAEAVAARLAFLDVGFVRPTETVAASR